MDAKELLKGWPGFANANAARILSSPAWRLETRYDGKPSVLTRLDADAGREGEGGAPGAAQRISLSVSFDDVPRILTFSPSPLFPDLWELRDHLKELPGEVLLAIVEKECGALFQFFEDASRQTFSISGLSAESACGCAFRLSTEGGEFAFWVDPTPTMEQLFGQLANIDVTHGSIRALSREVTASYATLKMSEEESAALKPGDCLVLPDDACGTWALELPDDGCFRIVAPESRVVSFAELADETLGPVPPGDKVEVRRNGRKIAAGVFSQLGSAPVVKITED